MQMTWKVKGGLFTLLLSTVGLAPSGASAITAELAKQCNVLVGKQFPPREAGNPAAGSAKGNGQAERDYFKKCVENNGKMDDANAPAPNSGPAPNAGPAPKAK
jgi:hypothetical protein